MLLVLRYSFDYKVSLAASARLRNADNGRPGAPELLQRWSSCAAVSAGKELPNRRLESEFVFTSRLTSQRRGRRQERAAAVASGAYGWDINSYQQEKTIQITLR